MEQKETLLLQLITDYIACSSYMCNTLKDNFKIIDTPLLRARRTNLIPKEGFLSEGFFFNFHGGGCYFEFGNSSIDVDFGPNGRVDGFDSYRLYSFMETSEKRYKYFSSEDDVANFLNVLLIQGTIIRPGWFPNPHLYYLVKE